MKTTKKKFNVFLEMTSFDPKQILKDLKSKKIKDNETSNKLLAIACSKLLEAQQKTRELDTPTGTLIDDGPYQQ